MSLKDDFKDDILDLSANEKRKYQMISNSDGTVSFIDVTTYLQEGDLFGAGDINETNKAINNLELTAEKVSYDNTESGAKSINVQDVIDELNSNIESCFQLGTNRKAELVSSLAYSGLGITEDSTWEEIFAALQSVYPEYLDLCTLDWESRPNANCKEVQVNTTGELYMQILSYVDSANSCKLFLVSPEFDVTDYDSITIVGESLKTTTNDSGVGTFSGYRNQITLNNGDIGATGVELKLFEHPASSSTLMSINITIDVSEMAGFKHIVMYVMRSGNFNKDAYLKIKEIRLNR